MMLERRHQTDPARIVLTIPRADDPAALLATFDELAPNVSSVRMEAELTERVEQGLVPLTHGRRLQEGAVGVGVERVVGAADPIQGLYLAVVGE
jgi:hypothetical protein